MYCEVIPGQRPAGEGAFGFIPREKLLLAKAPMSFGSFGWLLAFAKAKAGWKAQPKGS